MQVAVSDGRLRMAKVSSTSNPADVFTKYKTSREYQHQMRAVNVEVIAKESARGGAATDGCDTRGGGAERAGWMRLAQCESWADALDDEFESQKVL